MKALLIGAESAPYADLLRSTLRTPWDIVCHDHRRPDESRSHFETASALVAIRFDATHPPMPALRLLQAPATGLDGVQLEMVPRHVTVCNAYGHEIAVAEYNIFAMLACAHDVLRTHREFSGGRWCWSGVPSHPQHDEVQGATVCLVGLGRIGIETARRAKALGMRVLACNRTVRAPPPPEVDELGELSHVTLYAARADFVIVNCALTPETRGLVSRKVLAAMKRSAFIINVARGPLIDEEALFRALQACSIAGAVLDVWYRYPSNAQLHPRPSEFPFHELDNVIMTPHVSGWTRGMVQKRWAQIAANLDRLTRGEPLINVVRAGSPVA